MNDSEEERENYFSAGEEDEVWLRDGIVSVVAPNPFPLSRPNPNRIYGVLWRTEMFQERGPQLKLHMLEGNFGMLPEESLNEARGDVMDQDLWCQLSDDLINRILFRLPFACQCRLRTASRTLRSTLPESPAICAYENSYPSAKKPSEIRPLGYVSRILGALGFMRGKAERPSRSEECFRSDRAAEQFARRLRDDLDGSQVRKIHHLDLSFAPWWIVANRFRASRDGLLYMVPAETPTTTEGASSSSSRGPGELCILNPFTRTWRTLPPLPKLNNMNSAWQDWCEVLVDPASPSHFIVYVIVSTEDEDQSQPAAKQEWFICQYSSSKSTNWFVIPGDCDSPLRYESLCFAPQFLYSWYDGNLSTYDVETGKLLRVASPGDCSMVPSEAQLLDVERTDIVEYKGTIYAALSLEVQFHDVPTSATVIGISKLSTDTQRWEEVKIMTEWARSKSRMLELVDEKEMGDEYWLFLDYTVVVLGDYICFKVLDGYIHGGNGRRVVSQSVVGFHVASQTWKSFDLHIPHLLGAIDLEVFEPKCLHVYL